MRVFFDTNVLPDVLLNRAEFVDASEAAILRCEAIGAEIWISWHGLATLYYLLRRRRTEAEAMQEVDRILAWARIAAVGDHQARRARTLGYSDFEDAMQAVCAEACGADWLITRDSHGFANSVIPVATPTNFIRSVPAP